MGVFVLLQHSDFVDFVGICESFNLQSERDNVILL